MAFTYKGTFTVTSNAALLPSTQTNFPVLVSLTDATLKTIANGGFVANANGYDIRFFSDSALTTAISFELERYVATTGQIIFWVNIASLALSTVFYCGFGDASLNTNASSTGTWNSAFVAVYHLGNGSALTLTDSTSNANTLTGFGAGPPSATTGQIYGGGEFNSGNSAYLRIASNASLLCPTAFTLSAWIKVSSFASHARTVIAKVPAGLATRDYAMYIAQTTGIPHVDFSQSSGTDRDFAGNTAVTLNTLQLLHGVYDGVAERLYLNGAAIGSNPLTGSVDTSSANMAVGQFGATNSSYFDEVIDEARISNVARSANWITAEYSNQSAPTTFISSAFAANASGGAADSQARLGLSRGCYTSNDGTVTVGGGSLGGGS